MSNNKTALKIFFVSFLSLLLFVSVILSSCSLRNSTDEKLIATLNDYENKIIILENEISHLKEDHTQIYAQSDKEIESLKKEIMDLKQQIESSAPDVPEDEQKKDSEFTYTTKNNQLTITGYTGKSTTIIIPSVINGYTVSSIGDNAFKGTKITSVSIPSTITSIGWFAFADCLSLTAAVIPDSVSTIGYEAFSGAKHLTIYASADSYATKYAKSYGITVSPE